MNVWMKMLALCHWPALGRRVEMWAVHVLFPALCLQRGWELGWQSALFLTAGEPAPALLHSAHIQQSRLFPRLPGNSDLNLCSAHQNELCEWDGKRLKETSAAVGSTRLKITVFEPTWTGHLLVYTSVHTHISTIADLWAIPGALT